MKWYANDKRDIDIQRMLREKRIIKKEALIIAAHTDQNVPYTNEDTGERALAKVALMMSVKDGEEGVHEVFIDSFGDRSSLKRLLEADDTKDLVGKTVEIYIFDDKIMRDSSVVITVSVKE